jgi:hypothetical protein
MLLDRPIPKALFLREIPTTRNNLNAGKSLRKRFNPAFLGAAEYERLKAI